MNTYQSIGVLGSGAWGTALAQVYARAGRSVLLWARNPGIAETINTTHQNPDFLPGISLSPALKATSILHEAAACDVLLLATPAQHLRATTHLLSGQIRAEQILVICAKGIELDTGLLMADVVLQECPGADIAIFSGPTFAADIAAGLPAAITLASASPNAESLQSFLSAPSLRPYLANDLVGAQIGGAVKNVVAIACGIVHGRGLGESGRAALMTRGVAEIIRLAEALGGRRETLLGMCGIGDLMLTATSMQSRNFSLGAALGAGENLQTILAGRKAVTEGVHTARAVLALAARHNVDMPLCRTLDDYLGGTLSLDGAIASLFERPLKPET